MSKKLCYIEGNFAYFTNDFEEQWGDDWNDVPYEHNAGEPYTHNGTEVDKLAFYSELSTPAEIAGLNSSYSVQDINEGKVAWLSGMSYTTGEYIEVKAGVTMTEFIDVMLRSGGEIFLKVEE